MRFFIDQCVPASVSKFITDIDHEALLLKDHLPTTAHARVIDKVQQFDALLLTLNGDFADIISYPPSKYKGIIALQVRNRPEAIPQILNRFQKYLKAHPERAHYNGRLILVESHRIRVR